MSDAFFTENTTWQNGQRFTYKKMNIHNFPTANQQYKMNIWQVGIQNTVEQLL